MTSSSSIAVRALLAVFLMIGFYLLAIAIAGGLLYIPYAEIFIAHRVYIKPTLFCVIGGLAILWSVLPRIDKFSAPGPRLTRERQRRLFEEVESVARATGQAMPAEVYLVSEVNAWVSQRGGLMGFGSRRVMGLGLGLMRVLTRSQLRAVLAHEFGHYYGGDTRLGPWVYKTRAAIGRTISSLGDSSILQKPFLWYGKMFLRITHAVSRHQEFQADALAARTIGARPLAEGLRTVHGAGPAFDYYWRSECAPVLQAGYRPPLAEGFQQFLRSGHISRLVSESLSEELKTGKTDPYDTHPPLKERLAAVGQLPAGDVPAEDPPAISLLEDLPGLEHELLASIAGPEAATKLTTIAWTEACPRVYLPNWKKLVEANRQGLSGLTPASLPSLAADRVTLGRRFVHVSGEKVAEDEAEAMANAVIGAALCVAVLERGGQAQADPGETIQVCVSSVRIEPFEILNNLAEQKLSAADWQQQCAALGIAGLELGQAANPAG